MHVRKKHYTREHKGHQSARYACTIYIEAGVYIHNKCIVFLYMYITNTLASANSFMMAFLTASSSGPSAAAVTPVYIYCRQSFFKNKKQKKNNASTLGIRETGQSIYDNPIHTNEHGPTHAPLAIFCRRSFSVRLRVSLIVWMHQARRSSSMSWV